MDYPNVFVGVWVLYSGAKGLSTTGTDNLNINMNNAPHWTQYGAWVSFLC